MKVKMKGRTVMKNKVTMYSLDSDGKSVKKEYTIIDSVTCDLEELLKDISTDEKEGQTE
jgi:hypothetical protein